MRLKIFLSIVLNCITFGIASLLNIDISLLLLISLIYIIPVMYNLILEYMFPSNTNYVSIFSLSLITTIFYFVFSLIIMSNPNFDLFIKKHTMTIGDIAIELSDDFSSLPQLLFVFLVNFSILFLYQKIKQKR
ncbi:hypothetical protein JOC94_001004 [Bacillus thermophilus]|uniref:NADH dehydrogenase subunit 6 n=1 Tax=Siminovitchia thermophila TaxID=1245522 RepID=A0ABS2R324_9BACI|nr:hypothetical protein [Siminovitchia thermophila]ONK21629.1 hypothetical protein BLX87_20625 [Bacillus sp. VT-16-64]